MALDLDQLTLARPCPAKWDEMSGDERVRHCAQCKLNVYNISEMTRAEALEFLNKREGRTCLRFFKRADGTLITQDCPVGLAKVRRRMAVLSGALAASILLAAGTLLVRAGFKNASGTTMARAVDSWLNPDKYKRQHLGW